MGRASIVALLLGACSFEPASAVTDGSTDPDATRPVDGAPNDGAPVCSIGSIDPCGQGEPLAPLSLTGAFDTDLDLRCRTYAQPGGGMACLVYADGVTIPASATLAVTGTRPLIIASTMSVVIDGLLDISSRRGGQRGAAANDASCVTQRVPENDAGGAAGGAGGSFVATGGDGGTGDSDNSLGNDGVALSGLAGTSVAMPGFARGGCRGSNGGNEVGGDNGIGGAGGDSGGAVWIAAVGSVAIGTDGGIRATGAGGNQGQVQSGGGGGGSGGFVVIEAAMIDVAGDISANSGSGGQGGTRIDGDPISGNPGGDGTFGFTPAPGGNGVPGSLAGPGGVGSAGLTTGGTGVSSIVGGGGGGGGAGLIHLVGPRQGTGTISPPPA